MPWARPPSLFPFPSPPHSRTRAGPCSGKHSWGSSLPPWCPGLTPLGSSAARGAGQAVPWAGGGNAPQKPLVLVSELRARNLAACRVVGAPSRKLVVVAFVAPWPSPSAPLLASLCPGQSARDSFHPSHASPWPSAPSAGAVSTGCELESGLIKLIRGNMERFAV